MQNEKNIDSVLAQKDENAEKINVEKIRNYIKLLSDTDSMQNIFDFANRAINLNIKSSVETIPAIISSLCLVADKNTKDASITRNEIGIDKQIVLVTPDSKSGILVNNYLQTIGIKSYFLPSWETLPHEKLSPRIDTMAQRNKVIGMLVENKNKKNIHNNNENDNISSNEKIKVLVTSTRSFLQPIIFDEKRFKKINIEINAETDFEKLKKDLNDFGYNRVETVTSRGDYAVHGGIIDIFEPTLDHPIRIEFFGDEIDSLEYFSAENQRTIKKSVKTITIHPCRELLIDEEIKTLACQYKQEYPSICSMLEKIENGIYSQGFESLSTLFGKKQKPLTSIIDDDAIIIFQDIERVRKNQEILLQTAYEFLQASWEHVKDEDQAPIQINDSSFYTIEELIDKKAKTSYWYIGQIGRGENTEEDIEICVKPTNNYNSNYNYLIKDLYEKLKAGKYIFIAVQSETQLKTLEKILHENDIATNSLPDPKKNLINILVLPSENGYEIGQTIFIGQNDITGKISRNERNQLKTQKIRKSKKTIDPISLKKGDFIVHNHHGIGKFIELTSRQVQKDKYREYIVIEYAPSGRGRKPDQLFVPTDSLDQISKYVGGVPTVNKMGGSDWSKTKQKARKAIRQITMELVQLYAKRSKAKGYAFSKDTPWQAELENSFEYVETDDQLTVIDEIKHDMEKSMPMDRLLCGDVGYGKTEVAVRAVFKAVQDGKQVAILVPTTLLARQHYETFKSRYLSFPIKVACLSRFTSPKETKQIIQGLAEGKIDVVIGTHKLLTGQIFFKDLGLIVIDEEQRFGVEHKEALKQLKTNIDVLSMTATPIPRTLEMAMTGIRQMSMLTTPPEDRYPIITYVGAYKDAQIVAAIKREILRDGQVFYVHNRVEDIDNVASKIQSLLPEIKVAVAHGQMNEHHLEKIIIDFWNREYDVLVCTTIVETGLDIPNVNTLIIDKAENFGLSQLHQLRGRVGRGSERAYAYFLYSENKTLTQTAHERLETIATNTQLGSGIKVAMKDLQIRGAGNLLGGQQSGHIEGVGFDLYMRMLSETISALKGEYISNAEIKIELPFDSRLPEKYIPSANHRLEMYEKFSNVKNVKELQDVLLELRDRFGFIDSDEISGLLSTIKVKFVALKYGLEHIGLQGKYLKIAPLILDESSMLRLKRLFPKSVIKTGIRTILIPIKQIQDFACGKITDFEFADYIEELLNLLLNISGKNNVSVGKARDFGVCISKNRPERK